MAFLLMLSFWSVVILYPLLQGWTIWHSRGLWRKAACAMLATAGLAYLWCIWWLFVWPRIELPPGPLFGVIEMIALSCGGPIVLLILAVIAVFGRHRNRECGIHFDTRQQ
jgi:hypothetical protein